MTWTEAHRVLKTTPGLFLTYNFSTAYPFSYNIITKLTLFSKMDDSAPELCFHRYVAVFIMSSATLRHDKMHLL